MGKGGMILNNRLVEKGLCVDFHIHSKASDKRGKDNELVKDGDIEHISILLEKLKSNHVDMFAITDHDWFDYALYKKLKEHEGKEFKKILPGVEFSVGIETKAENEDKKVIKQVHVIAIFDDSDDKKVEELEELLKKYKYDAVNPEHRELQMYSEKTFRGILQESNMNVCLIAHQKSSPSGKKQKSPDAKALGEEKFNELLNYEYFEAYEFKNENNHVFHSLFKKQNNKTYEKVRFITGSDCHVWSEYPKHDADDEGGKFCPTYLKCLPSFRGLAMALTDDSRIQIRPKFFQDTDNWIKEIHYSVCGEEKVIPLSKGINAIIGDNSKGKSMFLHALTKCKIEKSRADAYKDYLTKHKIVIQPIDNNLSYSFDAQGDIRSSFEKDDFASNKLMKKYKPKPTDSSFLQKNLTDVFRGFFDALEKKFQYDEQYDAFAKSAISLEAEPASQTSLYVSKIPDTCFENCESVQKLCDHIRDAISDLNKALVLITEESEKDAFNKIIEYLSKLQKKYGDISKEKERRNSIREQINEAVDSFICEQEDIQDNRQQAWTIFQKDEETMANSLVELLSKKDDISKFQFKFAPINPAFSEKPYGNLKIVSRFASNRESYDAKFCEDVLASIFKQNVSVEEMLDIPNVTKEKLNDAIKNKDEADSNAPLKILEEKVKSEIDQELKAKEVIIENGADITTSYSAGFNASNYIHLLSEAESNTIYIIDQPEDDISQISIKESVIKDMKKMAQFRQIILVTHNPQFVVNLDADNVLYFHDDKNKCLTIDSGALEYFDEKIDMLKIVSENLDGGVDSLKKRWKRYEKRIAD